MENRNTRSEHRFDFTCPQIFGLALLFAGVSESLRNLWRLVEGGDAPVSLIFSLVCAMAGAWIIRNQKKNREQ